MDGNDPHCSEFSFYEQFLPIKDIIPESYLDGFVFLCEECAKDGPCDDADYVVDYIQFFKPGGGIESLIALCVLNE